MVDFSFLEHAKDRYFAEFERKRDLNAAITFSVGVASVLAAASYALALQIKEISSTLNAIAMALLCVSATALMVAVIRLILSHVGHGFSHLGSIDLLTKARQDDRAAGQSRTQTDVATANTLAREYAACAGENERVNDLKSAHLHKANTALVWATSGLFLAGLIVIVQHIVAIGKN